ncbi:hypothetical protein [Colwellia piezophila]|uniref:hypothetical protein n=1 Tax=Colwellia piezophila TaxID=211668 RepID=UPI00037B7E3D|nr:hypothetical protein [Colwellia piezophila]
MKTLIFILVLLLSSCDNDSKSVPTEQDLIISTVDINGDAYPILEVVWWYESTPDVLYNLVCDTDLCHTWQFPQDIEGAIFISGSNSVIFENDEFCFEVFSGQSEFYIAANMQQELTIEILYIGAVCS